MEVTRELDGLVEGSRRLQDQLVSFRSFYAKRRRSDPLRPGTLDEIRSETRRFLDQQAALEALARKVASPGVPVASIGLAADVVRHDNFLALLPLLADQRYRRLVNQPDIGYGIEKNALWAVAERICEADARRRLERSLAAWRDEPESSAPVGGGATERIREIIEGSATYSLVSRSELDRRLPRPIRLRRDRLLDGLAELGDEALYLVSEGFGNAIGSVELRKGKLWQRDDVLGHLQRVLRPLDILLEKTPFRLTDLFIPGHFGHVAVWMGRRRKLQRLRIWEHPGMQSERWQACKPLIEEGRGVLEALREGVELNALRVFANVDDLAILRPRRLGRKRKVDSLVRGFHQFGKEYDFNFDVESTGTIVCSELPYHVYPWVDWQTEEQIGRFTISPDDIAKAALGENPHFGVLAFYHDGSLVPPAQAKSRMKALIEA